MDEETIALATLSMIPLLGAARIKTLIAHFGSATEALRASATEISAIPGFGIKVVEHFVASKKNPQSKQNLDIAHKFGIQLVTYKSPLYPQRLFEIPDHPVLLYVQGDLLPADARSLALVGTRGASFYGLEMAERISEELAYQGFTIVSGLARGVDTASHLSALKKGRTVAVIGSGLGNIYPKENKALADQIAKNGALISEFPMMTPPDRQNFPQRNRIVAGMAMATVLIEAPEKSGALITMDFARRYGRPCFALSGRVDQNNYRGNHALIKEGKAQLIENAKDIVKSFDGHYKSLTVENKQVKTYSSLNTEELSLLKMLPSEELSIEEIIGITKLSVMKLNVMLMSLVLKKVVKEYPGKVYKKLAC